MCAYLWLQENIDELGRYQISSSTQGSLQLSVAGVCFLGPLYSQGLPGL